MSYAFPGISKVQWSESAQALSFQYGPLSSQDGAQFYACTFLFDMALMTVEAKPTEDFEALYFYQHMIKEEGWKAQWELIAKEGDVGASASANDAAASAEAPATLPPLTFSEKIQRLLFVFRERDLIPKVEQYEEEKFAEFFVQKAAVSSIIAAPEKATPLVRRVPAPRKILVGDGSTGCATTTSYEDRRPPILFEAVKGPSEQQQGFSAAGEVFKPRSRKVLLSGAAAGGGGAAPPAHPTTTQAQARRAESGDGGPAEVVTLPALLRTAATGVEAAPTRPIVPTRQAIRFS